MLTDNIRRKESLIRRHLINRPIIGFMLLAACGEHDGGESFTAVPALIPAPLHIEIHADTFFLMPDATIGIPAQADLRDSTAWIVGLVEDATGLSLRISTGRPAAIQLELVDNEALQDDFASQAIEATPESYSLRVDADGVRIRASTTAGLFYGLTTLWQLLADDGDGAGYLPTLDILDTPAFGWRGVMLDSARHMQSPEFIKRYIDWMSLHKLNVFHWHLTDDQAWRLEVRRYPRLTDIGGWRVPEGDAAAADIDTATGAPRQYGGFYSQEEVREIVAHAESRFITIVPEINVPGHASAAIAAYPELGVSGHGIAQVPARWGIFDNVLNLEESTLEFFENVLLEVTELFPGKFIHIGGDEVVTRQWEGSDRIAERMRELGIEDISTLQNYYVERLQAHLAGLGRRVIGWDEILEGDLPPEAAVMSWRGVDGAIAAAAKGHQTVLSPAPTFYLDHIQTNAADGPPGRGGIITARDIYEFDLLPDTLRDDREFLLGVQGNLWTEHVRTEERVTYMSYPRAVAIAELGWSSQQSRSWDSFAARLETHGQRLGTLGIDIPLTLLDSAGDHGRSAGDGRIEDRELDLCGDSIVLALEDDAPLKGERESFLVDIMNPCWILREADLSEVPSIKAAVGQLPFNFEIGEMIDEVVVEQPDTREGELRVRLGDCDGPIVATLPLAPAVGRNAVTELPGERLVVPEDAGDTGDLCFSFTRHDVEPIWVIDWVQVVRDPPDSAQ